MDENIAPSGQRMAEQVNQALGIAPPQTSHPHLHPPEETHHFPFPRKPLGKGKAAPAGLGASAMKGLFPKAASKGKAARGGRTKAKLPFWG